MDTIYAVIRTTPAEREIVIFPLCAGCAPDELAEARMYDIDYGPASLAPIVVTEHNRREDCARCGDWILPDAMKATAQGNRFDFA